MSPITQEDKMRKIRYGFGLGMSCVLLLVAGAARPQSPASDGKIDFRVVKYDGLAQEVLKHKGKVVIVDAWGITCIPCIKGMPHLLEMQKKYGDKGLVAITLHVDPQVDEETKAGIARILNKNKMTTINLALDEPQEVWREKLHSNFIPNIFVFNREGKWTQFSATTYDDPDQMYEAIEKTVAKELAR
jgi:thiol-disulfide isomerase/thioredoxin